MADYPSNEHDAVATVDRLIRILDRDSLRDAISEVMVDARVHPSTAKNGRTAGAKLNALGHQRDRRANHVNFPSASPIYEQGREQLQQRCCLPSGARAVISPHCTSLISAPWRMPVTNDIAVFAAMRLDPINGKKESDGRRGTRASIRRDGMEIDAASLAFCPHEWINSSGYVDLELVRKFPLVLAF